MKTPQTLFCERVLLPQGWARDTKIDIDSSGTIVSIKTDSASDVNSTRLSGPVVPPLQN